MYDVEIRRTTHGVAHIKGADLPSVAFGQGYASASDHMATIADQVVKVRSERSHFFGAGDNECHINSDFGYKALGVRGWAEDMALNQPPEIVDVVEAFAAGVNRWLSDHGPGAVAEWARDAAWVRPLSAVDLFTVYADAALMGSGRNLVEFVGSAHPPGSPHMTTPDIPLNPSDHPGSNGWAFGGDVTLNGRGMVMANPHFPWYGDGRFWECHLTIPGEMDVYGAALVGTPGVHIGFNRDVAWTHTFSRGNRFVVYSLDLPDQDPTRYRFGDDDRAMTPEVHSIDVLGNHGEVLTLERELWRSHHGPMLNIPLLGWSDSTAFTYRDANDRNDRFLAQFLAMDRADSVESLRSAIHEHQGLPWVNVIAADRFGEAWYADPSPTPNVIPEVEDQFRVASTEDLVTALFYSQRVAMLNGSDPATEWVDDDSSRQAGCVPVERLPEFRTRESVFNSNDPYWVCHPHSVLDTGPVFCGIDRRGLSPRSRMNAAVLAGEAPSAPDESGRWAPANVWEAVLDNRSLLADQLLDDLVDRLSGSTIVEIDGHPIDIAYLVEILRNWDRCFNLESRGALLWREFLAQFSEDDLRNGGALFATPFDAGAPAQTPCGLTDRPGSIVVLENALGRAAGVLTAAGVDPRGALGEFQYIDRSGERIPLHGANEVEGIVNVVAPVGAMSRSDLEPAVPLGTDIPGRTERTGLRTGGYQTTYGASFLMVVSFEGDGPEASGLLTYGQSGDSASPHHADQTAAFSRKELRRFAFTEQEISKDPALTTTRLTHDH